MKVIPKPEHGSEAWLLARWRDDDGRVVFGASDAPALMNASPYTSRGDLFVDKLQRPTVKESNAVFHRGNVIEPVLVAEAGRLLGVSVVTPDVMYCDDRFRISLDGVDDPADPAVVVEAKTTTRYRVSDQSDLPVEWLWQGYAQTLVTGAPVYFSVLDRDMNLSLIECPQNDEAIDALRTEADAFAAVVESGNMPDSLDEFSADQIATLTQSVKPVALRVDLPADALALVEQLVMARSMRKTAEQEEAQAKDELARLLRGAEIGSIGGMDVVSWKSQGGKPRVDTRALLEAHPELRTQFTVAGAPFRAMRVLINTMKEGE